VGLDDLAAGDTRRLVDITDKSRAVFRDQGDQGVALMDRLGKLHDPTIIAGDFNSTRDTAIHAGLRKQLVDTWGRAGRGFGGTTMFLGWLPLRVDYVYVTPDIAVHSARVVEADCSDHQGVVADLALRPVDGAAHGAQGSERRGDDGTEGTRGR
jgi:endonuclease/exonuclease/phosphatase (EEP) superfamily protein YafD